MKKILFILFCFVSLSAIGQNGKDKFGKYVFWDTAYFKRVVYNSGSGVVHLGIDTVAGSPTFGKLVRKTASGGGVTTMANIGASPNADGATISGSTLTLQPASGTFGGVVTTGTQTVAGDKNLAGNTTLQKYAVGWQFVVTSAGTETLTATSLYATSFTGTTTHTLVLPDATTLKLGQLYRVKNNSTGLITINKNGGSNILTLSTGEAVSLICTDISGSAGTWEHEVTSSVSTPSLNKGVFVASPTSADIVDVWQTPVAITVTSLKAILRGTSPSVTYNVRFGTDITSATTVFTSDITCTSITTGCSNSSGFNDATIPAGSFIWIFTSAASGTINSISFTINYTED